MGQDATLTLDVTERSNLAANFAEKYRTTFGYDPPAERAVEVVSFRTVAGTGRQSRGTASEVHSTGSDRTLDPVMSSFLDKSQFTPGDVVLGPMVIQDPFSTLYLSHGWQAKAAPNGAFILTRSEASTEVMENRPEAIVRELFRHRFDHLVREMGTMLQRSAISTNVKERADFSCALLDPEGELITSAPHIPVHLGALGLCVRMVREQILIGPGDTIVTNHPATGGSHLPDVTLITPVFDGESAEPAAYIANRAHHAEIGGITPGSMPPGATSMAEEGVVIPPMYLIKGGVSCLAEVERILTEAPYPTRRLSDNLADLNAQLAANQRGVAILCSLLSAHGSRLLKEQFSFLKQQSLAALGDHIRRTGFQSGEAVECLDDGTKIHATIRCFGGKLHVSFEGTAESHSGNLNATPAIIQSAVLYVLRLWTQSRVPLNEGMMKTVTLDLPLCFLNPVFDKDPARSPAVVGGNVETSQRVVDTLLKALGVQACSQGTMNNFLFGDESFGYYETICGGSGAGPGHDGTSGIHTHMTNTAITDPEILEHRYPVRVHRFSIREGSGGQGMWRGGDGIIREIEFLKTLEVSLLTQHRSVAPYGLNGGSCGSPGKQSLNGENLPGIVAFSAKAGDHLVIETPGGGGCGVPSE